MTDERAVLVAKEGGVVVITLNRPDRLNAFNEAQHVALREAFQEAKDDSSCRAVLLNAAGRAFCAGQDLSQRRFEPGQPPPDLQAALERNFNRLALMIRRLPKPVVAAVQGVAAGAGMSVALAADIVLAAKNATFVLSFAKVGLVPDAGGSWILPRLVGHARARALTLLAEPITGAQAADWGLVWRAVDAHDLGTEAMALARRLAEGPTRTYAMAKQLLDASATNGLAQQLSLEARLQGECGRHPNYKEGVTAFLEKRATRFSGD